MSDHNFNPFIADKYNLNIAVILNSFIFWTRTNAAKNQNFHEGRYWFYGTPQYFKNYFFYFTTEQIKYAIEQCLKNDLLTKRNFNKKGYDRTNWYALTDKVLGEYNLDITCLKPAPALIRENSPMDKGNFPDALGKIPRPIPNNKMQLVKEDITSSVSDFFLDTKTKTPVISESADSRLLAARSGIPDSRSDDEFLNQVKFHIEKGDLSKFTHEQRINGVITLLKRGGFKTPLNYKLKSEPTIPTEEFNKLQQEAGERKRKETYENFLKNKKLESDFKSVSNKVMKKFNFALKGLENR